jgi:hypothetical protein
MNVTIVEGNLLAGNASVHYAAEIPTCMVAHSRPLGYVV